MIFLIRNSHFDLYYLYSNTSSTDKYSLDVLTSIKSNIELPVPVTIHFQENSGVSAARNTGINKTQSSMVLILDGDDSLETGYIEDVSKLLYDNPSMIIASSWMRTFGVLDAVVCPTGGNIVSFLHGKMLLLMKSPLLQIMQR